MKFVGKFVTWSLVLVGALCGAVMIANRVFPKELQPKKFAAHIEVFKMRKSNPTASAEDLKKLFDETPEGLDSLMATLKSANGHAHVNKENTLSEVDKLFIDELTDTPFVAEKKKPKDIVIDGSNGFDPMAEEKVQNLAIPDHLKAEILKNYRRTGVLPSIVERSPAQEL